MCCRAGVFRIINNESCRENDLVGGTPRDTCSSNYARLLLGRKEEEEAVEEEEE